jgi:hypothetical protein
VVTSTFGITAEDLALARRAANAAKQVGATPDSVYAFGRGKVMAYVFADRTPQLEFGRFMERCIENDPQTATPYGLVTYVETEPRTPLVVRGMELPMTGIKYVILLRNDIRRVEP